MWQINGKISAGLPVVWDHIGWGCGGVQGSVGSKCHWDGCGVGREGKLLSKSCFVGKYHVDARKSSIKGKS